MDIEQTSSWSKQQEQEEFTFSDSYFEDLDIYSPITFLSNDSYHEDLQLAAELGNTLLEKNKDLEATIKHQQNIIDDQFSEIEFLTRQTTALKEVNESRLRIYEQIEISLSELEENHHKLTEESAFEKDKIRSLSSTVELLENRCEELQRNLEDAEQLMNKRKERRKSSLVMRPSIEEGNICQKCNIRSEERKTSVCLQDLFAGVGVLQAENKLERRVSKDEDPTVNNSRKVSLDQVDNGLNETITELQKQIDILSEERRQLLIKILKLEESTNNNDYDCRDNVVTAAETLHCSCEHSNDNMELVRQNVIETVNTILSRLIPDTEQHNWLDSFLLISVIVTVFLGIIASLAEIIS